MKIRNGFVSNSSSSSFIVQIKKRLGSDFDKDKDIANEQDIEKLSEYGFQLTTIKSPFDFSYNPDYTYEEKEEDANYMRHSVVCNQDEVLDFLVKNNIPFRASCQYGHNFCSYRRNYPYVLEAANFGLEIDMYGEDHINWEHINDMKKIYKENIQDYGVNNVESRKRWKIYCKEQKSEKNED